jgi:hypothetical protein
VPHDFEPLSERPSNAPPVVVLARLGAKGRSFPKL